MISIRGKKHFPQISVIMVTYNEENSIEKAILSVLDQKYENVELIIIDGKSKDGTADIIRKYEDRILNWISEPDSGIYDAMNKGIRMAKGEWIYFLGADDIILNCLHKVVPYLRRKKTIYYGDVFLPHKNKTYSGKFKWHTLISKNINHQSIFYPRMVFDRYQYNERYSILADYDLNLRCWGEGYFKYRYIPLLIAVHNGDGVSHQQKDEAFIQDKPSKISIYFKRRIAYRNSWLNLRTRLVNFIDRSLRLV